MPSRRMWSSRPRRLSSRRDPVSIVALVFDSLLDGGDSSDDYRLRFEHPALRLDVRITAADDAHFDLLGRLDPAGSAQVELQVDHDAIALVETAPSGEFRFPRVPSGLVRFVLTGVVPTGSLRTDWFRL